MWAKNTKTSFSASLYKNKPMDLSAFEANSNFSEKGVFLGSSSAVNAANFFVPFRATSSSNAHKLIVCDATYFMLLYSMTCVIMLGGICAFDVQNNPQIVFNTSLVEFYLSYKRAEQSMNLDCRISTFDQKESTLNNVPNLIHDPMMRVKSLMWNAIFFFLLILKWKQSHFVSEGRKTVQWS